MALVYEVSLEDMKQKGVERYDQEPLGLALSCEAIRVQQAKRRQQGRRKRPSTML